MLRLVSLLLAASLAAAVFDPHVHHMFKTLPRHEFINFFNSQNFSYNITEYHHPENIQLFCAHIDQNLHQTIPAANIKSHNLETITNLPKNFDAREKWPKCPTIREIYDQDDTQNCGSCWTFGTATSISDRICIHTHRVVRLAEQDFECCDDCNRGSGVCKGGSPAKAFDFWVNHGLVTQQCKPYNIDELKKRVCLKKCVTNSLDYTLDKNYGRLHYLLEVNEENIMAELVVNGPLQAGFSVYDDFITGNFGSGIYEHKFGSKVGDHSVRVIGYGEENGVKYWLAANSWGTAWADKGYFKVKRFDEGLYFETYMIGGML